MHNLQIISIISYYVKELNIIKGYLKELKLKNFKLIQYYDLFSSKYNYVNVKHNNTINFLFKNIDSILFAMKIIEKNYNINNSKIETIEIEIKNIEKKINNYNLSLKKHSYLYEEKDKIN